MLGHVAGSALFVIADAADLVADLRDEAHFLHRGAVVIRPGHALWWVLPPSPWPLGSGSADYPTAPDYRKRAARRQRPRRMAPRTSALIRRDTRRMTASGARSRPPRRMASAS